MVPDASKNSTTTNRDRELLQLPPKLARAFYAMSEGCPWQSPVDCAETEDALCRQYIGNYETLRALGCPKLEDMEEDDIQAVMQIRNIDVGNGETYTNFKARLKKNEDDEASRADPRLPHFYSKSDDRNPQWVGDTGEIDANERDSLMDIFRKARREGKFRPEFLEPPIRNRSAFGDIITASVRVISLFIWTLGDALTPEVFKHGAALCILSGFGLPGLRQVASKLGAYDEDFAYWATCPDNELFADIIKSRELTGYPPSLLRADFGDLQSWCETADKGPRWMMPVIASHIIKHSRIGYRPDGSPFITVAYQGKYAVIPFSKDGVNQPLSAFVNRNLWAAMRSVLSIRHVSAADRMALDDVISGVINRLHPDHLCALRDPSERRTWVVPPHLQIALDASPRSGTSWVNTGICIPGIREMDLRTGDVRDAAVTGVDAITYSFDLSKGDAATQGYWESTIPHHVTAERPSVGIMGAIKNIVHLDHPIGMAAMLDATILCDVLRCELAGTAVGNALRNEFPLFIAAPIGTTKEATTNQGKTSLTRLVSGVMVPGLTVVNASMVLSAPAFRAACTDFYIYKTAHYDEFQPATSPEHPLSASSLQTLSTGGSATPGRALENDLRIHLEHPLFLNMKVVSLIPDLINRAFVMFMDVLNDKTRATDAELASILSGALSARIRLSTLMWIERNPELVQKIRNASLVSGDFRFNGHLTVASLLAPLSEVNAYMRASHRQCRLQHHGAVESGLAENIGLRAEFDPHFYLENLAEAEFDMLCDQLKKENVKSLPVLAALLHDVRAELNQYRITIPAAKRSLQEAIEAKRMVRDGRMLVMEERVSQHRKRSTFVGVVDVEPGSDQMSGESRLGKGATP